MKARVPSEKKAQEILSRNLRNLKRKGEKGGTLTEAELRFCEFVAKGQHTEQASTGFARNSSELAEKLGTSRQLIAHHAKNPESPGRTEDGRYDVGKWRRFLADNGRKFDGDGGADKSDRRAKQREAMNEFAESAFWRVSNRLPVAMEVSLDVAGVEISPMNRDKVTLSVWWFLAASYEAFMEQAGHTAEFLADPIELPGEIEEIRKRLAGGEL